MSMPRAVRHINEIRILDALVRLGTTTRAELARELDLMRSTVGNQVVGLIEQGVVREVEADAISAEGRTGRPGQQLQLNPAHSAFIAVDIGVGHHSVVAVDLCGRPFKSQTVAVAPAIGDIDETIRSAATLVRGVMKQLPAAQQVRGICVVVPGLVDREGGVLRAPVLGWQSVPVQKLLAAKLKWAGPLITENDANAFAAAELYGRRVGGANADGLFVYLDAGVGGGLVSQGKPMRGHSGYAGEIGHIHLGEHGFDPATAVQGSFESYVARPAVLARFKHHGGQAVGFGDFIDALAAQSPPALRTLAEWAWLFGRGIASLISVLDPGRIVLGGPVAALYPQAEAEVIDSIRKHLVQPCELPSIEVSSIGPEACAIGGAMILHHEMLSIDQRLVFGPHGEPG